MEVKDCFLVAEGLSRDRELDFFKSLRFVNQMGRSDV